MADLDDDEVTSIIKEVMDDGGKDADKALAACQKGMDTIGDRFETGEYFVGDLIYAGEIMTTALGTLKPALVSANAEGPAGKMVMCTVKGDLHDIGKNIVKALLEASGMEVYDLGIDVEAEKIIAELKAKDAGILGLSGVLTLSIDSMKSTIEAIEAAGMRDKVKIIIGGNPITAAVCEQVGADDWAQNPKKTVNVCRAWCA